MKKRISLIALALLCALSLCFAAIPAFAEGDLGDLSGESESTPAGGEESTPAGGEESEVETGAEVVLDDLTNVALNCVVSINNLNTIEQSGLPNFGYQFVVDGNTENSWHGQYINNPGATALDPTILTIDLGAVREIGAINVCAFTGPTYTNANTTPPLVVPVLPLAFYLEISSTGAEGDWEKVGEYAYDLPVWDIHTPDEDQLFVFDEMKEAAFVRIVITDNSGYVPHPTEFPPSMGVTSTSGVTVIGEIEVLGIGDPVVETESETKAPVIVNPNTGNNNNDYDDETEAETEDETIVETVVETEAPKAETEAPKAETKAPETAAPAADTADEGCASVVGMGVVAILTAAAAAVVLKKKD